jgi:hypothetical protein
MDGGPRKRRCIKLDFPDAVARPNHSKSFHKSFHKLFHYGPLLLPIYMKIEHKYEVDARV